MSRTSIEIDDRLLRRAARITGLKTTREIIHRALEVLVKTEERKSILTYFGG